MRGVTVLYTCKEGCHPRSHETATYRELASNLAAIKECEFAGDFDASLRYGCPVYFVPNDTLCGMQHAQSLGILGEHDLFGGVVPFPFVGTKTITHPLLAPDARAPEGWNPAFASRVREAVLPGFSVFSLDDARAAGMRLLEHGPVRLKKATGIGGTGQSVATDAQQLEAELAALDAGELSRHGMVVEQNLADVVTHSVGQVRVGNLLATYCGVQRLTHNNHGAQVYGGSELNVVRGDFDALLRLDLEPQTRMAVAQACQYHAAAMACYPGMFASRSNYDVAQGLDEQGRWRSGVLEQSWRIGGASGAEVAALAAFQADPALAAVRASTTEIYGHSPALPADAKVYYRGIDDHVGPITKFSRVQSYANS